MALKRKHRETQMFVQVLLVVYFSSELELPGVYCYSDSALLAREIAPSPMNN